jgi:hypothetical protein
VQAGVDPYPDPYPNPNPDPNPNPNMQAGVDLPVRSGALDAVGGTKHTVE